MTEHIRFADWDAAYVLGSLSAADRHEFERHLAECPTCATAVAELAGMPGLLAKVPPVEAEESLAESTQEPPDLMPRIVDDLERKRRRNRGLVGLSMAMFAAVLAIAPIVVPAILAPPTEQEQGHEDVSVVLDNAGESPLAASVRLIEQDWGTRIEMECHYRGSGDPSYPTEAEADYALYLTNMDGDEFRVATWSAAPGSTVEPSATTRFSIGEIRTVDVRAMASGTVLLRGSP